MLFGEYVELYTKLNRNEISQEEFDAKVLHIPLRETKSSSFPDISEILESFVEVSTKIKVSSIDTISKSALYSIIIPYYRRELSLAASILPKKTSGYYQKQFETSIDNLK